MKTLIWSNQGEGKAPAENFLDFDSWYSAYPTTRNRNVILRIEDPVQMTYTSGTESLPKGVIISNQALIAGVHGQHHRRKVRKAGTSTSMRFPSIIVPSGDVFMNPIFWGRRHQYPYGT